MMEIIKIEKKKNKFLETAKTWNWEALDRQTWKCQNSKIQKFSKSANSKKNDRKVSGARKAQTCESPEI